MTLALIFVASVCTVSLILREGDGASLGLGIVGAVALAAWAVVR